MSICLHIRICNSPFDPDLILAQRRWDAEVYYLPSATGGQVPSLKDMKVGIVCWKTAWENMNGQGLKFYLCNEQSLKGTKTCERLNPSSLRYDATGVLKWENGGQGRNEMKWEMGELGTDPSIIFRSCKGYVKYLN